MRAMPRKQEDGALKRLGEKVIQLTRLFWNSLDQIIAKDPAMQGPGNKLIPNAHISKASALAAERYNAGERLA